MGDDVDQALGAVISSKNLSMYFSNSIELEFYMLSKPAPPDAKSSFCLDFKGQILSVEVKGRCLKCQEHAQSIDSAHFGARSRLAFAGQKARKKISQRIGMGRQAGPSETGNLIIDATLQVTSSSLLFWPLNLYFAYHSEGRHAWASVSLWLGFRPPSGLVYMI